ncbi:class A beta-lactamase [Blastochloris tepida]|uniref:Beta-lactamase n=1 Tax=Blastochloris tepida TaxID=2233851 RepID=A0A348G1S1_9HYPH|nr:class A beta-lactamase [Blastochloris tepida]BBF93504.1 beta-lactamase [Blastochloris tepida]
MISRRTLLAGPLLAAAAVGCGPAQADSGDASLAAQLAGLERAHGGRLGVAILDTGSGRAAAHRGDERFALCSTFKLLAAGLVLARVDRGEERLDRRIAYDAAALVPYSPITGPHAGEGLTVGALCEAAVTLSDNTAANLLLDSFGGPAALTAYLRSLGDAATRLDRREPALNEATPGDARDTTTPLAMLQTLRTLVLGEALSDPSRAQLAAWLRANRTGDKRLRAGVPKNWQVGDKTGSGGHAATNDVGILWPPGGRPPILVAAYYAESPAIEDARAAVLAEVGRLAAGI